MVSDEQGSSAKRSAERSAWGWLPLTVQALAAIGALAYATIRVSFQYFYDPLGVTTENVGGSSTTILAQSSLRVVEFALLFAFVPVLLVVAAFLALDRWAIWPRAERLSDAERLRARLVLAVPAVALFPLYQWLTNGRTYSYVISYSLIALWVLSVVSRKQRRLTPRGLRDGLPGVIVVFWVVLVVFWIVLTSLGQDGRDAGVCARNGIAVSYIHTHRHIPGFQRIPILRVGAEPVDPADATVLGARSGARMLYLGQANGTAIVWDATDQRTLLVPSSRVIQLVPLPPGPPSAARCKAYIS
jgi:amino acid transporter